MLRYPIDCILLPLLGAEEVEALFWSLKVPQEHSLEPFSSSLSSSNSSRSGECGCGGVGIEEGDDDDGDEACIANCLLLDPQSWSTRPQFLLGCVFSTYYKPIQLLKVSRYRQKEEFLYIFSPVVTWKLIGSHHLLHNHREALHIASEYEDQEMIIRGLFNIAAADSSSTRGKCPKVKNGVVESLLTASAFCVCFSEAVFYTIDSVVIG